MKRNRRAKRSGVAKRPASASTPRHPANKYRDYVQAALDVIYTLSPEGVIKSLNPAFETILGFSRADWIGRHFTELVHPDDVAIAVSQWQSTLSGRPMPFTVRIKTKSGKYKYGEFHATARKKRGKIVSVLGVGRDITERKLAEEALRRSEERYRSLVQNAAYGICRLDKTGALVEGNPALAAMLGYESQADFMTLNVDRNVFQDPHDRSQLLEQSEKRDRLDGVEVKWKRKEGTPLRVRLSGRKVCHEDGTLEGFEIIAEDVHQRRLQENQLLQAQKMEAVGRFAGGVANDFRKLLHTISQSSDVLLKELEEGNPLLAEVYAMKRAAEQASELTRQLLAVSQQQTIERTELDLNALIVNMKPALQMVVGDDIQLAIELEPSRCYANVDPRQIERVILNLVTNARDSMPEGGKITLETLNIELDVNSVYWNVGLEPGPYVLLSVSDTGAGIDPDTRLRLFEPFSTPREPGKGLELATTYGVVKQNGGEIEVYSGLNLGTTFVVYLPQSVMESVSAGPAVSSERIPAGTVLLMEEERPVRALARRVLLMHRLRVLEAGRLEEAEALCKQHPEEINLLITDVVMTDMMGRKLAAEIKRLQPGIRILFTTGYADDAMHGRRTLKSGEAFIQKPFTPGVFIRRVCDLLHHPA